MVVITLGPGFGMGACRYTRQRQQEHNLGQAACTHRFQTLYGQGMGTASKEFSDFQVHLWILVLVVFHLELVGNMQHNDTQFFFGCSLSEFCATQQGHGDNTVSPNGESK